jgi:hypothetical protein
MTEILILFILAAMWIWGVKCLFSTGHLLESAGDWIDENLPEWVYKPTIGCQACMASVHGTMWYWLIGSYVFTLDFLTMFVLWPVFCICLCGLNFVLLEAIYQEKE